MAMNNCLNCFNANILMMNQHQMLTTFYNTIIQNDVNAKETAEKTGKILREVIEKVEKVEKNAQEATARLSSQIVKLTNELTDVKNELTDVKNELTVVKKELTDVKNELTDVVHTLSAREIGASADRFALNKIFPKCIGNFGIKTLAELKVFLNNVGLNNNSVSQIAKTSWFQLSQQEQVRIKDDFHKMLNAHPGILTHIKCLKKQFYYAHRISSNGKTEYTYFSAKNSNKHIAKAIKCCLPLVPIAELNR